MVVQLTISLCTVAVRLFAITYLDNKNSRKRERMWIYLHTYDIIPSLTVKFIKTPLKALFYLGFSAVPFRFTI